jgi:hypothetical protein
MTQSMPARSSDGSGPSRGSGTGSGSRPARRGGGPRGAEVVRAARVLVQLDRYIRQRLWQAQCFVNHGKDAGQPLRALGEHLVGVPRRLRHDLPTWATKLIGTRACSRSDMELTKMTRGRVHRTGSLSAPV